MMRLDIQQVHVKAECVYENEAQMVGAKGDDCNDGMANPVV